MAAAWSGGVVGEEEFDEREMEVAAILVDLQSLVLARAGRRQQKSPPPPRSEIPSWGRRRPRTAHPADAAEEKPAADSAAGRESRDRGAGAASPDTPLAFPEHDAGDEEAPPEETKERAHKEWVQEQRGVVASLSSENAHLSKQIEEFKARLLASKSTNDSLKQMQQQQQPTKQQHKKRNRPEEEDEEGERRRRCTGDRPELDLNEPAAAEEAEDGGKPQPQPQWRHRGQQEQELQQKAALSAAARRRRQDIRRAKAAAAGGRARGRRG